MRKSLKVLFFATIIGFSAGPRDFAAQAQQPSIGSAFDALRTALSGGSVGKIEFDLRNRGFKLSDIELKNDRFPGATFRIREIDAKGIDFPADWRLSADSIDVLDLEVSASFGPQNAMSFSYKAPRITLSKFNGPIGPPGAYDAASPTEAIRLGLERLVATSVASITIPSVNATITPLGVPGSPQFGPITYSYSGFALRDVRNGRIGEATVDRTQFVMPTPPEGVGTITADGGKTTTADLDLSVLLALFDTSRPKTDQVQRLQGRSSIGPYDMRFEKGGGVHIGAIEVNNVGVRPAKLKFVELMALATTLQTQDGGPPPPAKVAELANLMADIHESISMELFEIRDVVVTVPQTPPVKLGAFRLKGFENGKIAEIAIEGVDAQTPQRQPIKIGRFALKGLDLAGIDRLALQFGGNDRSPEKLALLLPLLQGAEIKDLVAPSKDSGGLINIERFVASWGQFVGPFPTAVFISMSATGPIDASDGGALKLLSDAGVKRTTISMDLGADWAEQARLLTFAPISMDVASLFSFNARLSADNVGRELFSLDPDAIAAASAEIVARPLELIVRDAGALDLAIAQRAAEQGISVAASRRAMIDDFRMGFAPLVAASPDLQTAATAVVRFLETSKSTITVRVTPKGRVPLRAVMEAMQTDPTSALSQFTIEVTTTR